MNHLSLEILHPHFKVIKYSKIHIILVLRGRVKIPTGGDEEILSPRA
ncbi:hypothetical protein OKW24_005338 [Peribacillus simplex]|nr:hypothetical protein [Peribacillus simplex]SNT04848.1 hypothetical protein SAMN05444672_105156 [Bacillus sp. OK838]